MNFAWQKTAWTKYCKFRKENSSSFFLFSILFHQKKTKISLLFFPFSYKHTFSVSLSLCLLYSDFFLLYITTEKQKKTFTRNDAQFWILILITLCLRNGHCIEVYDVRIVDRHRHVILMILVIVYRLLPWNRYGRGSNFVHQQHPFAAFCTESQLKL